MSRRGLILAAALSCSCGGDLAGDPDGGPPHCELSLSGPTAWTVGEPVELTVEISSQNLSGVAEISWSVDRGGEPVDVVPIDLDGRRVEVTPTVAGPHRVVVTGNRAGTSCIPDVSDANALPAGAVFHDYRLRIVPPPGADAPAQEIDLSLPAAANYVLGDLGVAGGSAVSGRVVADGVPIEAYLRASHDDQGRQEIVEGFATGDGFALTLLPGSHRLLVVPESAALAPLEVEGTAAALSGDLDVGGGVEIGGAVTVDGAPVAGATVSVRVGGLVSSLGETGADGSFALRARPGSELSIQVTPPVDSGLPALARLGVGGAVGVGTAIAVRYDGVAPVAVDLELRSGGAAIAGARTTWFSTELSVGATVELGDGAPVAAEARVRRGANADGAGRVALTLAEGRYQVVVVEPATGRAGVATVDLAAAPSILSVPAVALAGGRVVDAGGQPIEGARLRASPRGVLAAAHAGAADARTDADGRFTLALAAGAVYDLRVVVPGGGLGRLAREIAAAEPGQGVELGDLVLPDGSVVEGRLSLPGGLAVAGAQVSLLCVECGDRRVLAEAVTDSTGRFRFTY